MAASTARIAVYYAPAPADPLFEAGASWLGRDPESGAAVAQPDFPGIDVLTEDPRRYGFHATLKPPMHLAEGSTWRDVLSAARLLAARLAPFALPPLAVAELDGFLAVRETAACPPLQALADASVRALDPFRAPPSDAELARRRRARLTGAQEAMLARWGYPYVFETWFFHMTLTRRLTERELPVWEGRAAAHFAPALLTSRRVDALCLFTQSRPDAPFRLAERLPLTGSDASA